MDSQQPQLTGTTRERRAAARERRLGQEYRGDQPGAVDQRRDARGKPWHLPEPVSALDCGMRK